MPLAQKEPEQEEERINQQITVGGRQFLVRANESDFYRSTQDAIRNGTVVEIGEEARALSQQEKEDLARDYLDEIRASRMESGDTEEIESQVASMVPSRTESVEERAQVETHDVSFTHEGQNYVVVLNEQEYRQLQASRNLSPARFVDAASEVYEADQDGNRQGSRLGRRELERRGLIRG
jgi:hypothetical protein